MSKWTPGKWEVRGRTRGGCYAFISAPGWERFAKVVVKMKGDFHEITDGLANARLIAAAPEMAELLALVVDGAEAMGWDVGPKIRALLAKVAK